MVAGTAEFAHVGLREILVGIADVGRRIYKRNVRFEFQGAEGTGCQVEEGAGRFLQVAGLKYTFDPKAPAGSRVSDVMVGAGDTWAPIDPAATYKVVSNNYVRTGGDGFSMFVDAASAPFLEQAVIDIEKNATGGSLTIKAPRIKGVLAAIKADRGVLDLEFLATLSVPEARRYLTALNGVGPKTAVKWFQEFQTLEGIIAHAAELKPERFRETVAREADKLRMNLKLTTLPAESPLPSVQPGEPQAGALFALLEKLEMKSSLAEAKQRYSGQAELF